jgi:hypothetical protein
MNLGERKSPSSNSDIREALFGTLRGSKRCENDAWEQARLGAPGLGG